jgi:hypothetical protein
MAFLKTPNFQREHAQDSATTSCKHTLLYLVQFNKLFLQWHFYVYVDIISMTWMMQMEDKAIILEAVR